MILRINKPLSIDNLNQYPAEVVEQLERLLAAGVEARPDPARKNFYQMEQSGRVFFIHAFAGNRKVMLLASWPAEFAIPAPALG
jgi:hypothetical protein